MDDADALRTAIEELVDALYTAYAELVALDHDVTTLEAS